MTQHPTLNTQFLLLAQYGMRPIIPLDLVCRDYFNHISVNLFLRKVSAGEIRIPVMRMEDSQKSLKGIYVQDLADYIDRQRDDAKHDFDKIYGK